MAYMIKFIKNKKFVYVLCAICAVALLLFVFFIGRCSVYVNIYNVTNYGAVGDGKANDAKAIQSAIDDCNAKGGGQVLFPENKTYLCSPIELKSNCDIHISNNSTIKAIEDENAYQESAFRDNRAEGMKWIWAKDCNNISITGMGKIDGSCMKFMGKTLVDSYELQVNNTSEFDPRPHVLTMENIENLHINEITITGAAYWTVHLVGCYDVEISKLSIKNDLLVRNCDGIDIDHSKKVRISDCFIESGDDCICFKNRREFEEYGSCEDIVVNNCVMTSRSCAVKLGSENMDKINNVNISNCIITDSNRGIGIQNRDEGSITNISFNNITIDCHMFSDVWWGKSDPIYITSYPRAVENNKDAGWRFPKGATEGKCGEVSNIFLNNINATSENGCFVGCDTYGKVKDVFFNGVNLRLQKTTDYQGNVYDKRPCAGEGFIYDKCYGVYNDKAKNIVVNNFNVLLEPSFNAENYGGLKFGF